MYPKKSKRVRAFKNRGGIKMETIIYENKVQKGRWEGTKFITQYGTINKEMLLNYERKCLFEALERCL